MRQGGGRGKRLKTKGDILLGQEGTEKVCPVPESRCGSRTSWLPSATESNKPLSQDATGGRESAGCPGLRSISPSSSPPGPWR